MKKTILALLALVLLFSVPVFAKNTYYFAGDTVFTIKAGVDFPAFIAFYNDPERRTVAFKDTHINMGGYASISYQGYLNERFALGGELAYVFNYSHSSLLLTTVPITARLTYVPVQTGKFDIGMSLNLGGAFIRYNEGKYFSPFVSLTLTPTFFINENWGFGVEGGLMLTAEMYSKNSNKYKSSAFAGLMPVTLAITYRH
ncbi:MAG: hypothetical protein IJM73_04870 [Spirochaetales bacterium]|nr:hypothetical protein [Spirochaetales bacterium]